MSCACSVIQVASPFSILIDGLQRLQCLSDINVQIVVVEWLFLMSRHSILLIRSYHCSENTASVLVNIDPGFDLAKPCHQRHHYECD